MNTTTRMTTYYYNNYNYYYHCHTFFRKLLEGSFEPGKSCCFSTRAKGALAW